MAGWHCATKTAAAVLLDPSILNLQMGKVANITVYDLAQVLHYWWIMPLLHPLNSNFLISCLALGGILYWPRWTENCTFFRPNLSFSNVSIPSWLWGQQKTTFCVDSDRWQGQYFVSKCFYLKKMRTMMWKRIEERGTLVRERDLRGRLCTASKINHVDCWLLAMNYISVKVDRPCEWIFNRKTIGAVAEKWS